MVNNIKSITLFLKEWDFVLQCIGLTAITVTALAASLDDEPKKYRDLADKIESQLKVPSNG